MPCSRIGIGKGFCSILHEVLPRLGEAVAGDREGYRYLAESIEMHPDQGTLREMMRVAGFESCRYFNLGAVLDK